MEIHHKNITPSTSAQSSSSSSTPSGSPKSSPRTSPSKARAYRIRASSDKDLNPSPKESPKVDAKRTESVPSDFKGITDDSKTRAWKKTSMTNSMDMLKVLEEERSRRIAAENWRAKHEEHAANLEGQVSTLTKALKHEQAETEFLKKELADTKEKLFNATNDMKKLSSGDTLSPSPQRRLSSKQDSLEKLTDDSNSPTNQDSPTSEPKARSCNKKVISDMQDVSKQLNAEKKARAELEQWKVEQEAKMEDMKRKVRREVEERVQLEETLKKMEKELTALKKNNHS